MIGVWEKNFGELEDAEMLLDMAKEENDEETYQEVVSGLDELKSRIDLVELECMFSGEHDANNAMLTIHAGAGGTEAQDWVGILLADVPALGASSRASRPISLISCPATRPAPRA